MAAEYLPTTTLCRDRTSALPLGLRNVSTLYIPTSRAAFRFRRFNFSTFRRRPAKPLEKKRYPELSAPRPNDGPGLAVGDVASDTWAAMATGPSHRGLS